MAMKKSNAQTASIKKPLGKSSGSGAKHVKVDKYKAKADLTRADRQKLVDSLPSSQGLPTSNKSPKTDKKKVEAP